MADDRAVDAFVAQTIQAHGRIDILVNNAGGGSGPAAGAVTPLGTNTMWCHDSVLNLVTFVTARSQGGIFDRTPEMIKAMINTNLLGASTFCCQLHIVSLV